MADDNENFAVPLKRVGRQPACFVGTAGGDAAHLVRVHTAGTARNCTTMRDVVDAIRNRVVAQPKVRLCLLLPPAKEWRSACPRLIRLSERLTTALTLRTPNREETQDRPELGQAFLIADERVLLHFNDPRRLRGIYAPKPIDRTKEALELFREVWNKAQPDPNLRRLGI
ncbi:MAG: hypothetical protein U1F42_03905 [Candidatus Competibacteraceae bacterium]